ncbi:hypothetical protein Nepgr_001379 [Nepenthes gracilis]|uniref:Uncharacterized protein n=1 Tax=Nepenthes gracilis TaxID=150966 RepID=A0AAD3RXP9_NEPGR|nr:hypothetical protein Nepgr_001379 [Nepenthes gracilis]
MKTADGSKAQHLGRQLWEISEGNFVPHHLLVNKVTLAFWHGGFEGEGSLQGTRATSAEKAVRSHRRSYQTKNGGWCSAEHLVFLPMHLSNLTLEAIDPVREECPLLSGNLTLCLPLSLAPLENSLKTNSMIICLGKSLSLDTIRSQR